MDMALNFGNKKAKDNPYRYVYDNPDPAKAKFVGRWRNNYLDKHPDITGDPYTRFIALSPNGANKYPDPSKGYQIILPPDKIKDADGNFIGWAFRYR